MDLQGYRYRVPRVRRGAGGFMFWKRWTNRLLYWPATRDRDEDYGRREHYVSLVAADGTVLRGWFYPRGKDVPLIVGYPGKTTNVGCCLPLVEQDTQHSYLLLNYRGSGGSGGVPTESALVADAVMALDWAREQMGGYSELWVMGYSLGSGIAVQMAARAAADRLVLLCPYDKMVHTAADVARLAAVEFMRRRFPRFPLRAVPAFLCGWMARLCLADTYDSARYAPLVRCPVHVYICDGDRVVLPRRSLALVRRFTRAPVVQVEHMPCGHVEILWRADWRQSMLRYIFGPAPGSS